MFNYEKYKNKIKENENKARTEIKKKYVQIYKGELYKKISPLQLEYNRTKLNIPKIIVFDLDETLGSFGDIESLWSGINQYMYLSTNIEGLLQKEFNELMHIYPEFLRTGIIELLSFIYNKKREGDCFRIYIYTNNQCPSAWTYLISNYMSSVVIDLNASNDNKHIMNPTMKVFDHIVCSFKINNQIIETMRTTQDKTYTDFIRCTMISKNVEICFIDNTYFSKMTNDKVYYIQPRSYYHGLPYKLILERLFNSHIFTSITNTPHFLEFIYDWFKTKGSRSFDRVKTEDEREIDIIVQQKIWYHVKEFFLMTTRNVHTKKIRSQLGRFTRKKR